MILNIVFVVIGLVFLFFGGEGLVRGAVAIARRMGLSTLLVSMVVVGFGTSVPELLVSVQAALAGTPDIALGNVIGSNIANILLILGVSAVLGGVACQSASIRRDVLAVLFSSLVVVGLSLAGMIGMLAGMAMILSLSVYLGWCYVLERKSGSQQEELGDHIEQELAAHGPLWKSVLFTLGGLAFLVIGARLLITGAVAIAMDLGVPEAVIGLTLVAVGTSLPELATAVIAAMRKHADVVIGNILGSNLFNVMAILGVTGLISPIPFVGRIAQIDVWVMLAVTLGLVAIVFLRGHIGRVVGALSLAVYTAYTVWLFIT